MEWNKGPDSPHIDTTQAFRRLPLAEIMAHRRESRLERRLNAVDLATLGVGAIVGTGIFVLTGVAAAEYAGPGVILSFIVSGITAALAAIVYTELAAMLPAAGSAYTYAYVSLGEVIAWLVGWNLLLEYVVAASAVSIGWGGYLGDLFASFGLPLPAAWTSSPLAGGTLNVPAIVVPLTAVALLSMGAREGASANRLIVMVKLAAIGLFLVVGALHVNPTNWSPFLPFGATGVIHGAAIVFFAYLGFDAVATAAEEVQDPRRDMPRGILASLGLSTLLYVAVAAVITGLVSYTRLDTPSPVTTALLAVCAGWATSAVALGALAGLSSVLIVSLFALSRILFAIARDGLLPPFFTRLNERSGTPTRALWTVGLLIAALSSFLPVGTIAELANIGTLTAFIAVAAGVLVLRRTQPAAERPFRVPWVPWLPLLSIALSFYLMLNLPRLTWIRFAVWLAAGLVIYGVYGFRHSRLRQLAAEDRETDPVHLR